MMCLESEAISAPSESRRMRKNWLVSAEPMVLQSKAAADSPLGESDDATGRLVNNQIVVPLRTHGRQPFGCIQLVNKKAAAFPRTT